MLSFSRKTDYALIALAHLAGREGDTVSAREIAESYQLSAALLMKILKVLHHAEIVASARGVKGGYSLATDLHQLSLYDLIDVLKSMDDSTTKDARLFKEASDNLLPTEPALLAVHSKLMRFLKAVKLSDLVLPGHRIDVPVELVGRRRVQNEPTATALVG